MDKLISWIAMTYILSSFIFQLIILITTVEIKDKSWFYFSDILDIQPKLKRFFEKMVILFVIVFFISSILIPMKKDAPKFIAGIMLLIALLNIMLNSWVLYDIDKDNSLKTLASKTKIKQVVIAQITFQSLTCLFFIVLIAITSSNPPSSSQSLGLRRIRQGL